MPAARSHWTYAGTPLATPQAMTDVAALAYAFRLAATQDELDEHRADVDHDPALVMLREVLEGEVLERGRRILSGPNTFQQQLCLGVHVALGGGAFELTGLLVRHTPRLAGARLGRLTLSDQKHSGTMGAPAQPT